nr:HigA family addiction module antitoxin [Methylocapsa sp. S129]
MHPGEILRKDVFNALNMPVATAAKHLGVSRQTLRRILAGKMPVTPTMALRGPSATKLEQRRTSRPTTLADRLRRMANGDDMPARVMHGQAALAVSSKWSPPTDCGLHPNGFN